MADFDVPINVTDSRGDTILHHMIQDGDYDAVHAFLESLKPNQRFNCMLSVVCHSSSDVKYFCVLSVYAVNDNEDTVLHEMMKRGNSGDYQELLSLLHFAQSRSIKFPMNVSDENGNLLLHLMLQKQSDLKASELKLFLSEDVFSEQLDKTLLRAFNKRGESAL